MGGRLPYLRPVDPTDGRMSSFIAHTRRVPPSQEAGVDYYCPIGTPVYAGVEGRVFEIGGSVVPATGRFVTVDITDGRRLRDLHFLEWRVKPGQLVEPDTIIGLSGASGYGSEFFGAPSLASIPANTGGPHVHRTLWPTHAYRFGVGAGTLDFEQYVDKSAPAGGNATNFPNLEDDMILIESLPDRGRALIGPGYYRKVKNSEELTLATKLASKTLRGNARQFDVWKALALQGAAPTVAVSLSDAQLEQIADAAREGGADAIAGLEFIIKAG